MTPRKFLAIFLLSISACAQAPGNENGSTNADPAPKDTVTIFKNISSETCACTFSTMTNNKPSTSMDSCYKVILDKYNDSLQQLGFDPATQAGELKLANEVIYKLNQNCPDLFVLMQKEIKETAEKKLLFKGALVSQTKLSSGLFKITLKSSTSKETKTFYAKHALDEAAIKKYEPGYELTIEYEVVKNKSTDKDENHLKEWGQVTSVGAVKKSNN